MLLKPDKQIIFSFSLVALPLTIALECSFETQHLLLLYLKEVQEPCPVSNLSKSWHAQNKLKLLRTNTILTIYRNVSYWGWNVHKLAKIAKLRTSYHTFSFSEKSHWHQWGLSFTNVLGLYQIACFGEGMIPNLWHTALSEIYLYLGLKVLSTFIFVRFLILVFHEMSALCMSNFFLQLFYDTFHGSLSNAKYCKWF